MKCDKCQMLSINGVPCHETGCPNSRKTWIEERQEWVLFVECRECGCEVEEGTVCSCQECDFGANLIEDDEESIENEFMQPQVTKFQTWIEVQTDNGIEYLDAAELGLMIRDSQPATHPLTDKQRETIITKLSPYCEGTIQEWKSIKGYGARWSAPGYMDCTPWTVFDTEEEAEASLKEE